LHRGKVRLDKNTKNAYPNLALMLLCEKDARKVRPIEELK